MRRIFRLDVYAATAGTLALAISVGGGSYAVARTMSPAASSGATATSPILVFSAGAGGKLAAESHRSPVTGKPKVKKVGTGAYWVTIPGVTYNHVHDPAVCSTGAGDPVSITVAFAGAAKHQILSIAIQKPNGNGESAPFQCAVYRVH